MTEGNAAGPALALRAALLTALAAAPCAAEDVGERTGRMWHPCVEWSRRNPSWEGNPFDVVATVTFRHADSGERRATEMFYVGDKTWRFRFAGTRLGRWAFRSTSRDPQLDGLTGTVIVKPNPDDDAAGFLTHKGNRFARHVGNDGRLEAYRFTVYMNRVEFTGRLIGLPDEPERLRAYVEDARRHGFGAIFVHVVNSWFQYGARKYIDHKSVDPDPKTFAALEEAIRTARGLGCRVHFWAWGDQSRRWTPIGVGGINGPADRRLQRYIAARLGPMVGWSMGYGFDLHEWTKPAQLDAWAKYLHEHMGWDHLLCTRGHRLAGSRNNMDSYDGFGRSVGLATSAHGPKDYHEIVRHLDSDAARPHFYEERHSYLREGFRLDMRGTRRLVWWQTLAGGMGGFFGFYPNSKHPYPNPEQLRCASEFWHKRFLLEMVRANELTDGYALRTPDRRRFVFYREDAAAIAVDLTKAPAPLPAVAVDAAKAYKEIDLGKLTPGKHTLKLPRKSDWAVAVGTFDAR